MLIHNYCKKCKAEVPAGEACSRCGTKLTKTGERLSWTRTRVPVRDWFSWNAMLRVVVPVIVIILTATILIESIANGTAGIQAIFVQGFFWVLMSVLGLLILATFVLLLLQGSEVVRYVLDAKAAHAYTCLREPKPLQTYTRLLTMQTLEELRRTETEPQTHGLTCIRQSEVAWANVKHVTCWPETHTILLYRPRWWQVICIRCSVDQYAEVEEYVKKRLARNPIARKSIKINKKT